MLMSPSFKAVQAVDGVFSFVRQGEVTDVVIPESLKQRIGYDADIDESGKIVFSEGEDTYILTDKFSLFIGKDEEVDTTIFFVDGGMMIQLKAGRIMLQAENGTYYEVDEAGEIGYPTDYAISRRHDITYAEVFANACSVVEARFALPTKDLVLRYVNNLLIDAQFHYFNPGNGGPVFKSKFSEFWAPLALGRFEFTNYAQFAEELKMDDDHVDIADLDSIPDADEEEDEEYNMEGDEEETEENNGSYSSAF